MALARPGQALDQAADPDHQVPDSVTGYLESDDVRGAQRPPWNPGQHDLHGYLGVRPWTN